MDNVEQQSVLLIFLNALKTPSIISIYSIYIVSSTIRGRNFVLDLFSLTNKKGFIVNYTVISDGLDLLLFLWLLLVGGLLFTLYTRLSNHTTLAR